jgi:2-amino-4-hydroxy-6-hydroxymethyldihydropteridine diphosphokinase
MAIVGLILGSNLDGRNEYLKTAIRLLELNVGKVVKQSSLYKSPPWGYDSQNDYLNQVLILETQLDKMDVLNKNLLIEKTLGRERSENGYTDRTIDIDILYFNEEVFQNERLILPHPRLHLRKFCLMPLAEVEPNWSHPGMDISIKELISLCKDSSELHRIDSL